MPIVIETYREFAERHGNDPVDIGHRLLFGNGAMADHDGMRLQEPPGDPTERLKFRKLYVVEQVGRAEKKFHSLRKSFSEQASLAKRFRNLPSPPEDAPQLLMAIKAEVERWREELREVNAQLAETPESQENKQREEMDRDQYQRVADLSQRINEITI